MRTKYKAHVFVPSMRCSSIKAREKPKAILKGQKGKHTDSSQAVWAKGKGKHKTRFKAKKGQKGKRYTAEEASVHEIDANEGQWLESADISPYDTWQADSSSWDWTPEADWEESEGYYQDW